ncbi:hypothetical protein ACFWC9_26935 [Streptomyces goshikiensis]|uniref:hypothetical protein n=1 Tax=Streptomyces goshikiensis TaxID=1942 RepID=UPI003688FBB9
MSTGLRPPDTDPRPVRAGSETHRQEESHDDDHQAIAFVYVLGSQQAYDMAPSERVDPGWHSFMLHTQEYAAWCQERFGHFVHHSPNARVRTRPLMVSVADRIAAAGFAVDARLWGTAADCNQPACCGDGDGC